MGRLGVKDGGCINRVAEIPTHLSVRSIIKERLDSGESGDRTCVGVRRFCSRPAPSLSPQPSRSRPSPRKRGARHRDRSLKCDSFPCGDGCAMRFRLYCCALRWGRKRGGAGVERGLRRGRERGEGSWGEGLERIDRSEWGRYKSS